MTEVLTICREWTEGYTAYTRTFTLEFLLGLQKVMDLDDLSSNGDDFTGFITGLSCDTYADEACDIMEDMYKSCSRYDEENKLEGCFNRCMKLDEFKTCYTVFRLWNSHLTPEDALGEWYHSCLTTLEGIIEDKELDEE